MNGRGTAYDTLGVSRFASLEAIHRAYRLLARRYHPDGTTPDPARMIEINQAYVQLKTGEGRSVHDGRRATAIDRDRHPAPGGTERCGPDRGPLGRRIAAAQGDSPILDFGRYAGWRISDLAGWDPEYLRWLSCQSSGLRYRQVIRALVGAEAGIGSRVASVR